MDSWDDAAADDLDDCRRRNHTPATLVVHSSALLGPRIAVSVTIIRSVSLRLAPIRAKLSPAS